MSSSSSQEIIRVLGVSLQEPPRTTGSGRIGRGRTGMAATWDEKPGALGDPCPQASDIAAVAREYEALRDSYHRMTMAYRNFPGDSLTQVEAGQSMSFVTDGNQIEGSLQGPGRAVLEATMCRQVS